MIVIISMMMIIVIVYHIFSSGQTLPSDTNQFSRSVRRSSSSSPTTSLRMGSTTTTCQIFSKKKTFRQKTPTAKLNLDFHPGFSEIRSSIVFSPFTFMTREVRSPSEVKKVRWKNGGGVFSVATWKQLTVRFRKPAHRFLWWFRWTLEESGVRPILHIWVVEARSAWSKKVGRKLLGRSEFLLSMVFYFRENNKKSLSPESESTDGWFLSPFGIQPVGPKTS